MSRLLLVAFNSGDANQSSGFAKSLGLPFDLLQFSDVPNDTTGAEKVYSANLDDLPSADVLANSLVSLISGYSHIAGVANMRGKDVMARVAGILDAGMVSDVIAIVDTQTYKRPIYAGSIIATVQSNSNPTVVTFRPSAFKPAPLETTSLVEPITVGTTGLALKVGESIRGGTRPDLSQARVVVSGGRPLKDAETFERVIGGLADKLGGAVGATRAAVDSGIAPNELQVGQTGKIVAPDLYIAAGISGSTQHMAGIKDSKIIVAINKDGDAPIFEAADYGLVADLFEAIPEIERALGSL